MRAFASWPVRDARPDDAAPLATIYQHCGTLFDVPVAEADFLRMIQTGDRFLVAEFAGEPVGAIRVREEDGIGWLDLLAARKAGAGPALLRAAEQRMQDRGIRVTRLQVPAASRLPRAFSWFGYLPVARRVEGGSEAIVLEKRLPLLTVREQRRSDAEAIAALADVDPWPFEQGSRPGWFVLADGERVAGVVAVQIARDGSAAIQVPILAAGYSGRGLEVWMLERAALYAGMNGGLDAKTAHSEALHVLSRDLEERGWERAGEVWVKRLDRPEQVNAGEIW